MQVTVLSLLRTSTSLVTVLSNMVAQAECAILMVSLQLREEHGILLSSGKDLSSHQCYESHPTLH